MLRLSKGIIAVVPNYAGLCVEGLSISPRADAHGTYVTLRYANCRSWT
jgi:hypothetical protein